MGNNGDVSSGTTWGFHMETIESLSATGGDADPFNYCSRKMNHKLIKTLWGLLAFSPWILFLIGVPIFIQQVPPDAIVMQQGKLSPFLIGFLVVGNLYVFLLFLIFLTYLGRMKNISNNKKWLWRGLMFFGHIFAMLAFWYFYIWKKTNVFSLAQQGEKGIKLPFESLGAEGELFLQLSYTE
jgi:hypothetical protein